jgi:hypothetical protein
MDKPKRKKTGGRQKLGRVRIDITLPPEIIKRADLFAKANNMTRSATVELFLEIGLTSQDGLCKIDTVK